MDSSRNRKERDIYIYIKGASSGESERNLLLKGFVRSKNEREISRSSGKNRSFSFLFVSFTENLNQIRRSYHVYRRLKNN